MNIEELKVVLSTVATVSDDAKTVAIWWFAANYGVQVVAYLAASVTAYLVTKLVVEAISGTNRWATFGQAAAKAWGGEGDTYSYSRDKRVLSEIMRSAPAKERKQ